MKTLSITSPYIELYKILKLENMAASGGEAKYLIGEGVWGVKSLSLTNQFHRRTLISVR